MNKASHDSETPAYGQQVITACAFIHHEFDGVHKVFLPKRADSKKFLPGLYELPDGHVEVGEDIVTGLKREIQEELGMTIILGDVFYAFTYMNLVKGAHAAEVIYFAKFVEPLESIIINPEDHSKFEWFSKQEILSRRKEITAVENVEFTQDEDPEYLALIRGFELLEDSSLNYGK